MDHDMGYLVLLAILATPCSLFALLLLAMATGVIHEPTPVESVAHSYRDSWQTLAHES